MGMSLKMGISDSVGASVSMGTDVSAKSGVAADGASAGATYQEHFRITEGDVAVETFLIMEYADQGSLDKRIAQGALKGQLVRKSSRVSGLHFLSCLPATVISAISFYITDCMSMNQSGSKAHVAGNACLDLHTGNTGGNLLQVRVTKGTA